MGAIKTVILTVLLGFVGFWLLRPPRYSFTRQQTLVGASACPKNTKEAHLLFGGSSLQGGYIAEAWKRDFPDVCLINFSRRPCKKCDVNIKGDVRDTNYIAKVFKKYDQISSVILSIKPELTKTSWRTFMEVNLEAVVEIGKLAKQSTAKRLIYVSSIACTGHHIPHHNVNEKDASASPILTDYIFPYDLSKRLAEDFILGLNDEHFHTIAVRLGGIIGGDADQFFHHRMFPFMATFEVPHIIDYGYAGNIADGLVEVEKTLRTKSASKVAGQFYFLTGEHIPEFEVAKKISAITGKPLLHLPFFVAELVAKAWEVVNPNPEVFTLVDLFAIGQVEQTFDNSKFAKAFPNYKPKYTILQALEKLYAPASHKTDL